MAHGPLISAWFWAMLESSECSLKALCRQLEQVTPDQLHQYRDEYDEAKDSVNPCGWVECQPHLRGECSEDHGDDFAAWVRDQFSLSRMQCAVLGNSLAPRSWKSVLSRRP